MLFDVTPVADALKPFSDFNHYGIDITPLLLMSHPGNRNARADALKSMLREIEETLGAVIGLFEAVAAIRDKLQNFTAAVANALSPALALPAEILAFIFKLFAEDADPTISPIAISHVCSRWRAVSLSLPSLWTRPMLPQKHKGIAEEFSRRSSPLPLHLSMRPLKWRPIEIEFSEEYAHRIQSLHLSAELSEDSLQSFSRCTPLLQLQDVSLDNEARYEHVHSALKTVRSLRLYGYPCTESSEFVTMEHLTELGIGKVDIYTVHHTLTRICAPALERVVFEDILLDYQDWTDASDLDTEDFVIPHLSIRDCNAYAWSAFLHWPWPQLKSFSIEITDMGGPELNILRCFELMVSTLQPTGPVCSLCAAAVRQV